MWLNPSKSPGHQSWSERLWLAILGSHTTLLREPSASLCHSTGRGHLEAGAWCLLDFVTRAFPFADANL